MRVIIDATNETGLVGLVTVLQGEFGAEVIAPDDTAMMLEEAGLSVIKVSTYTNSSGVIGGRIDVLNPRIFGGVIGREEDREVLHECSIPLIDYVIANLQTRSGDHLEEEARDVGIGRAALIHAGAMNDRVVVVCNPGNYQGIIRELLEKKGAISDESRYGLAELAIQHVARYELATLKYLKGIRPDSQEYQVRTLLS
jgi:phosphoribosylaminoimidazolecarboxamide formyltransferase/IMP cyclohydrolase